MNIKGVFVKVFVLYPFPHVTTLHPHPTTTTTTLSTLVVHVSILWIRARGGALLASTSINKRFLLVTGLELQRCAPITWRTPFVLNALRPGTTRSLIWYWRREDSGGSVGSEC